MDGGLPFIDLKSSRRGCSTPLQAAQHDDALQPHRQLSHAADVGSVDIAAASGSDRCSLNPEAALDPGFQNQFGGSAKSKDCQGWAWMRKDAHRRRWKWQSGRILAAGNAWKQRRRDSNFDREASSRFQVWAGSGWEIELDLADVTTIAPIRFLASVTSLETQALTRESAYCQQRERLFMGTTARSRVG